MKYEEFLGRVQSKARLPDQQHAVTATRVTLETLATRLQQQEAEHIAAQLPLEIGYYLRNKAAVSERFGVSDFFHKVSEAEHVDLPVATYHARVVVDTLLDAIDPGALRKLRGGLPEDWSRLFDQGAVGKLPASR